MANTYIQLYVQFVFAVKYRQNLISEKHREAIEKYVFTWYESCRPDGAC